MNINSFFYKVVLTTNELQECRFLGSAFPITPNGGLLTCRHVLNIDKKDNETLAVIDNERGQIVPIQKYDFSKQYDLDMAFIPNAFQRKKAEFFPILSPDRILMGEDVYSVGYYMTGINPKAGYFKGNIVNFSAFQHPAESLSLSYPVIEGLSGSPVLTYHNGPKVVGLCYGSVQSRVVASEIVEYQDDRVKHQETVNRIVELGQAYHANALISFLRDISVHEFTVSSERLTIPGLSS
ncbi:MAG: trypsin-like peptidase domain-containing protein [Caldilineaceae bacterium SB0661_bin_32]|uniref:Trypsin-like peptidase domain-containing protein n=1 Tax=Caldilineaceae bacterium SB0661_bin_32 TaxID=2605255 RepID=A0A6B1DBL6_9CHLR|nr:trypsin-like peptidase domain-containing protein [Caldilineaceae bacterium SB0661_bin_32]